MGPTPEQIGAWLKSMRERQGKYSQEQAAPHARTTTRTLYSWEKGKGVPPADQFFALMRLYEAGDLDLLDLIHGKGSAEQAQTAKRRRRPA